MTTSQKLWLGFGTLTALLLLSGVAILVRVWSLEGQVDRMANVARPRAAAARELEVSVFGYALNVRTFIQTDAPNFREKAAEAAAQAERHLADYQRLATTDRQRELGARFAALWRAYKDANEQLLNSKDSPLKRADSERLVEMRAGLDKVLNGEMQPEAVESYEARKEATFQDVRSIVGFAVTLLVVGVVIAVVTSVAVGRAIVRGEQAIAEQGERLRTTLASIGDGVISTDASGNVTYLNAVAESLTGWTNDEAAGVPLTQVFHIVNESTRQTVESPAARALGEGLIVGLANHTVLIAKDGTERPIDDSAAPIRCVEGELLGCVLVFKDITERKRAEVEREEAQRQIATTLESILDGFMRFDRDWRIVYVNAEAERINQSPREEMLGKSFWEVFPATVGTRLEAEFRRAVSDRVTVELENYYEPWSRWFAFKGYPSPDGGLAIYFRDITERKRVEAELARERERLGIALHAGRLGVYEWRVGADSVWWSPETYSVFGVDPHTFRPTTASFTALIHPDDRDAMWRKTEACVARREIFDHEYRVVRPDGAIRWVYNRSHVATGPNGEVERITGVAADITERKQAEDAVRRAEELLRNITDTVPALISYVDVDCRYLLNNRAYELWFGNRRSQITGRHMRDVLGDDAWSVVGPKVEAALAGQTVHYESQVVYKDAGLRWIDATYVPSLGTGGEIVGVVVLVNDITERKRAEEALAVSEERLRLALDAGRMGVWDWNVRTGDLKWSDSLEPLHGLAPGTFGGTIGHFQQLIYAEDRETVNAAISEALDTGGEFYVEFRNVRQNGAIHWIAGSGKVFPGEDGQPLRMIGIGLDVTRRKRAEQTARFLADASAALAVLVDFDSTLQKIASLAVPHFADWATVDVAEGDGTLRRVAVAHVDPAKVQLAHDVHRRFPPDPAAPQGVWNILRTGRSEIIPEITDELLIQSARDEEVLGIMRQLGLRSYIGVPLTVRGKTLGVITFINAESGHRYDQTDLAVADDLASRAAIAIENAQLYRELRDADQRKDDFLATLAHELRNPLAPIRNGLQVIRLAGGGGDMVEEARSMMDRQLNQMVRLVDDLLDVSRITRNKLNLKKQRVELAAVVRSAIETSRPLMEQSGHEFSLTLPPAPIYLDADQTRLAQVFSNLLNNAARYTEPGGHIRLAAERQGSDVLVSVQDDGIGIVAEMLPRIFEMFAQATPALERSQSGLGVGLSLVKGVVELHGGRVEARSDGPGRGSEFTVRLPVLLETLVQEAPQGDEGEPPCMAKCRILVVDDLKDSADSLSTLLRVSGHEVHTAYDGEEGVIAAEKVRPEVVLLDIGMPKLNGYDACRRIREKPWGKGIYIIALTGWGQDDDRRRTEEAGFNAHMVKPVDSRDLMKVLSQLRTTAERLGSKPIARSLQ